MQLDRERFTKLWRRCGGARPAAVFAELDAHYRAAGRYYHNGGHIIECLARMDLAADALGAYDDVELAIWFHDVIYLPGAADNETASARWFEAWAAGQLPADLIARVNQHIIATMHRAPPADPRAQFVADVDLSGLGMAAESFRRDGINIRKESAHLTDAEFCERQAGFLRLLARREFIYCTPFFRALCEQPARENIQAALARYARGEY